MVDGRGAGAVGVVLEGRVVRLVRGVAGLRAVVTSAGQVWNGKE